MANDPEASIESFFSPDGPRVLNEAMDGWPTPLSYINRGLLKKYSHKNFTRQVDRLLPWIDTTAESLRHGKLSLGARAFRAGAYLGYSAAYELLNVAQRNEMASYLKGYVEEIIGPDSQVRRPLIISSHTEQLGDFGWSLAADNYNDFMEDWGRKYASDDERYAYLKYGFGITAVSANGVLVAQTVSDEVSTLEEMFHADSPHDEDPPASPELDV